MSENAMDTLVLKLTPTPSDKTGLALCDQDGCLLPGQMMNTIVIHDGPKGYLTVTQTFRVKPIIIARDENSNG